MREGATFNVPLCENPILSDSPFIHGSHNWLLKLRRLRSPPGRDASINTEAYVVTDATFSNVVLAAELPVVVDFGADWCPPCQRMDPIVQEVASENQEIFLVAKFDTDSNPKITEQYRINALPTYIVFQDGKVIGRFIGGMPKTRFVQQIFDALNAQGN